MVYNRASLIYSTVPTVIQQYEIAYLNNIIIYHFSDPAKHNYLQGD